MKRVLAVVCLMAASIGGQAWSAPTPDAGSGQSAHADVNLPVEGVITNPDWIREPNGDDFATYYPRLASYMGLGGRTVLHCTVAADGGMEHCDVTSETPTGMGFGAAAIAMSGAFQMRPRAVDGRPVSGGVINIPIRFAPPAVDNTAPASPANPAKPRDAKTLALAHRLALTVHWDAETQQAAQRFGAQVDKSSQQQGLTSEETIAVSSVKAAADDYYRSLLEQREAKLADIFSDEELEKFIDFFSGAAGQAWFARQSEIESDDPASTRSLRATMVNNARSRFCQQVACLESAAQAQPAAKAATNEATGSRP